MSWVPDSSLALAWALPDEHSERADEFLDHLTPGHGFGCPHCGGMKFPMPC